MNLENTWLIMYHDEDYDEPAGIHTGNLMEILYKYYAKPQVWENEDYYFTAHNLKELETRGSKREENDGKTYDLKLSSVDFNSLSNRKVQDLLREKTKEFTKEFPQVTIIITKDDVIKFKTLNDKVQNELDSLSEEAKEYIRKNGI